MDIYDQIKDNNMYEMLKYRESMDDRSSTRSSHSVKDT